MIFTDLDFGDPRISIFSAEPASELKDYIEYIWYMKWDINLYFGYGDCLRKMFW